MNIYAWKIGVNNCLKQSLVAIEIQFIVDNIKGRKARHNKYKRIEKIPCII